MVNMGLDEFETVFYSVHLAKELHDMGRFDVLSHFYDEISYDWHYENIYHVLTSIFSRNYNHYDEERSDEVWLFEDDVISDYFLYAREYGLRHNLPHAQNPYVARAKNEVRRRLCISNCVDWKLLAYTKTKKTARKSKLVVRHYTDCGCNAIEGIAYGLVKLYGWFADKCAKFEALENAQKAAPTECVKFIVSEVMAA
jgi:hypothetical protein